MSLWARLVLWSAIGLFVLLNVIQVVVFGSPMSDAAALDARPAGYSAEDARAFLAAIDQSGQEAFFGYYRWIDTVFPPLLAVSLVFLFRQIRPRRSGIIIGLFSLLPLAYLVADLVENSFLKRLKYEDGFEVAVRFAQDATVLKYSILAACALVLIAFTLIEKRAAK